MDLLRFIQVYLVMLSMDKEMEGYPEWRVIRGCDMKQMSVQKIFN
jgi:hypothetical protein